MNSASPPAVNARVLIVDDDPDIRASISMVLELEGYDCELASGCHQGLERHAETKADLIVLDYRMPGMTGAEMHAVLRDRNDLTPIVFLSADRDIMTIVPKDATTDVMCKPFDIGEFLKTVRRLLGR